jgi:DNA-binding GntR family transcriptional regulator
VATITRLQKEPLTRRAVQAIRAAIFAGEYTSGQRLVEEDVSARLGVSRNVVREAFWQLEAQGLLQSDDYKGKSVTALSPADVAELIPLRLALESLAATWAARNITPESAQALEEQAERFLRAGADFTSYAEADFDLHQTIWRIAGNRQLAVMVDRIAAPMIALQSRICQPLLPDFILKEKDGREGSHHAIVEAIRSGDAVSARASMQKHILAFWHTWLKHSSVAQELRPDTQDVIDDALQLVAALAGVLQPAKADLTGV